MFTKHIKTRRCAKLGLQVVSYGRHMYTNMYTKHTNSHTFLLKIWLFVTYKFFYCRKLYEHSEGADRIRTGA